MLIALRNDFALCSFEPKTVLIPHTYTTPTARATFGTANHFALVSFSRPSHLTATAPYRSSVLFPSTCRARRLLVHAPRSRTWLALMCVHVAFSRIDSFRHSGALSQQASPEEEDLVVLPSLFRTLFSEPPFSEPQPPFLRPLVYYPPHGKDGCLPQVNVV